MKHRFVLAVCAVLIGAAVRADDWPQFRGPDRSGVSKEKGLQRLWPKEGPKLLWTFKDAGLGFSSVAVVKDVVYTLGTDKEFKNDIILAIDAKTGTQLWSATLGPLFTFKGNSWGDGPRSTPTIDGNHLYALGGYGDLVCVDIANKGKEVWRKNLVKDFGGEMMTKWGYSESPLVEGNHLICTPGGKKGTLAALDKSTGALIWRSKDWTDLAPYSSIVPADIQGVRQFVQTGYINGDKGGDVAGVDAKTGKTLWSKMYFKGGSYVIGPTAIVHGNYVYATEENGCELLEIDAKQIPTAKYKFKQRKVVKNNHGGVVLVEGKIYGHTDPGAWVCQDLKSGSADEGQGWLERNEFKCNSGAIIAADGLLYLYTDENGVGLAEANPKQFNLISKFTTPAKSTIAKGRSTSRDAKTWAHPVIANGVLYVRDTEYLFAFQVAK